MKMGPANSGNLQSEASIQQQPGLPPNGQDQRPERIGQPGINHATSLRPGMSTSSGSEEVSQASSGAPYTKDKQNKKLTQQQLDLVIHAHECLRCDREQLELEQQERNMDNSSGPQDMGHNPAQMNQNIDNFKKECEEQEPIDQEDIGKRKKRQKRDEEISEVSTVRLSVDTNSLWNQCNPDNSTIHLNQTDNPSTIIRKHQNFSNKPKSGQSSQNLDNIPCTKLEKISQSCTKLKDNTENALERKSPWKSLTPLIKYPWKSLTPLVKCPWKSLTPLVKCFQFGESDFNFRSSCAITRNRVFLVSQSQHKLIMFDRSTLTMGKPVYLGMLGGFGCRRTGVVHLFSKENTLVVLRHESDRRVIICNSDSLYEVTVVDVLSHLTPQGQHNEEYIHQIVHIALAPNMLALHVRHGTQMINSTLFFSIDTQVPKVENIVFLSKLDQSLNKNDLVKDGFNIYTNTSVFFRFGQNQGSADILDTLECFDLNTIRNPKKRKICIIPPSSWYMDIEEYITYGNDDGDLNNKTHRRNPMNLKLEPGNSYRLAFLCRLKNKLFIFNIKLKEVMKEVDLSMVQIGLSNWWGGNLFLFKHTYSKGRIPPRRDINETMDNDKDIKLDNSSEELVVINRNWEVEVVQLHDSFKQLEDVDYRFRYFADAEEKRKYLLQSVYHIDHHGVLGVRHQTLFQSHFSQNEN